MIIIHDSLSYETRDHSITSSASAGDRRTAGQRDEVAAFHLAAVRSAGTRRRSSRNPRHLCGRLWAEPVIEQASSGSANQRRGPEEPELRKSPVADKKCGTRAARRIDRRIRHRDADKVNQRE